MIEIEDVAPAWMVQTVIDWAVQSFHADSNLGILLITPGAQVGIVEILRDLGADDEIDNALEEFGGEPEIEALIDVYGGFDQVVQAVGLGNVYEWRYPRASWRVVQRASQMRIVFSGARSLSDRELEVVVDTLRGMGPIGFEVSDRMIAAITNYYEMLIEEKRS